MNVNFFIYNYSWRIRRAVINNMKSFTKQIIIKIEKYFMYVAKKA